MRGARALAGDGADGMSGVAGGGARAPGEPGAAESKGWRAALDVVGQVATIRDRASRGLHLGCRSVGLLTVAVGWTRRRPAHHAIGLTFPERSRPVTEKADMEALEQRRPLGH